jgi:formylglycine-generating enzyme required for sulfatase activity
LAQVNALRDAAAGAVPSILADLEASRADVLPRLRELWAEDGHEARRMRLALALLPVDPKAVRDDLTNWMLKADDPAEVLLARAALADHKKDLKERLWAKIEGEAAPAVRLRAAAALAVYDPDNPRWSKVGKDVVGRLFAENPFYQGQWAAALKPVKAALIGPLGDAFRDPQTPEQRQTAAIVLADYLADDADRLADLLLDADPRQYVVLMPVLQKHRTKAIERLRRELTANGVDRREPTLARRQGQAAATLLQLNDAEPAWPLFRHSSLPEARSQLIWRLALLDVDPRKLADRLEEEQDVSARRALVVALGDYNGDRLPATVRELLTRKLLDWYENDPDPGVHGAIDWLLRHGKEGPENRPLDWGQAKELEQIDLRSRRRDPDGKRRWYVNQQGQTMSLFPGPVEFSMGSPKNAPEREEDERLHRRRIERRFAVAAKAVTVEQYERFLKDRPDVPKGNTQRYNPTAECPITSVSWYAAAQYCNWLSEQEGVPETEWCYPKVAEIKDGMQPYPDYLKRTGYRLLTEAEWEYAARADADQSRCYGFSMELLPRYAWFLKNAQDRTWPVGQKRPNDFGLFDVHGNVWTWTQDPYLKYSNETLIVDKENLADVKDSLTRISRGGSFYNPASYIRSAFRNDFRPDYRDFTVGLRVARTYR